jgi:hypothetical protein
MDSRCVAYISAARLDYDEPGANEAHLEFKIEDGRAFVLNLSSSEAIKLSEGLSVIIQSPGFPYGAEALERLSNDFPVQICVFS